jgi:hypothetical protein
MYKALGSVTVLPTTTTKKSYKGILFSLKKEGNLYTYYNANKP